MRTQQQVSSFSGIVDVSEVRPLRFRLHHFTGMSLPRRLIARYRALNLPGANLAGTWPRKTLRRKIAETLNS
jgi:hypothetical protein